MALDSTIARQYLKESDFPALFIQALGWDHHHAPPREVLVDDRPFTLRAVAEKRGVQIFECGPDATGTLADYPSRRRIEKQVAQWAYEHLIIFTDAGRRTQVWQWVLRQPGRPAACREHTYHSGQPGDALIQKLDRITFPLTAEEGLTLSGVTVRLRDAFDKDRVTKRFYERFKAEHAAFLSFVNGIPVVADREWYASLMLNRLMFVYFIEKKGFLDGDTAYLRNRLRMMRERKGKDNFLSFYRHFLLRLFHEGLGQQERDSDLDQLLGKVPYLDGGLFDVHQLERDNPEIGIADAAFEKLFDFFDAYQWHLDDRPLRADNEINPDVLGYIFEKYINQKQMGAYYTKEDITEYISKYTVLPFLLDTARAKCKVAFENPNGPTVWDLLSSDPDRYIYRALQHGAGQPLPPEIARGLNPPTLHQTVGDGPALTLELRKTWNKPASPEHALPTETWREAIARRKRYEELKRKLAAGEVCDINDLITLNLDIRQFAQDAIENCEGPELLRAFWHAIEKVTIVDPTCGSGAFLFAALNILEPLYEACLDRMEAFVEDLALSGEKHRPEKFSDFRKVLERVAAHPNRRYFIFKSIILNNLFGVDIMQEAVEICKLRLFLKLAAQVEPEAASANLGIEPLPDIDFNIRAGNTLIGYSTFDQVKQALTKKLDFDNAAETISLKAADLQQAFDAFRARQVEGDGSVPTEDKQELRSRLKALDDELNRHLAAEYGVEPLKKEAYAEWLTSHQSFHWFVEFYGIMSRGGFDVIIGNPPYVEKRIVASQYVPRNYDTEATNNLYAYCSERAFDLLACSGKFGFIVPLSSMSTDKFEPLQRLVLGQGSAWLSNFDDRPSRLFDGLEHIQLTVILVAKNPQRELPFTSSCRKWLAAERGSLFPTVQYSQLHGVYLGGSVAKAGSGIEVNILDKLWCKTTPLAQWVIDSGGFMVFYTRKVHAFLNVLDFVPKIYDGRGKLREPSEQKALNFDTKPLADAGLCTLNSTLFRWFLATFSDCRNVNRREVLAFPIDLSDVTSQEAHNVKDLARSLSASLQRTSQMREMRFRGELLRVQCIIPRFSKEIIDEIDYALARHYAFSEEELDFVVNYDFKYRMGRESEEGEE